MTLLPNASGTWRFLRPCLNACRSSANGAAKLSTPFTVMIVAVRNCTQCKSLHERQPHGATHVVTTKRERNLAALEPVLQCIDSRVDARETNLDNARDFMKNKKRKLSEVSVQISNFRNVSLTLRFRHRFYVSLQFFVIHPNAKETTHSVRSV